MKRTFRYRLYPTRRQADALNEQLAFACTLYNAALEQRRDWWRRGRSTGWVAQGRDLTQLRRAGMAPEGMNAGCQENVLRRVDRAYEGFFRRVRSGAKAGYPRFRSRNRYDSLTWRRGKAGGAAIRDGRLRIQGIGHIKVRWHRDLPSEPLTTTVRRTGTGKWYVSFAVEIEPSPLPSTGQEIGVDLGVTNFIATSDGETIKGPRAYRDAQHKLRVAQRRLSRRQRGSHRRDKARRLVAQHHERIRAIRRDHAHKLARRLVNENDLIAVEDLRIRTLIHGPLAKHVADQGWGDFIAFLHAKAEDAARVVVEVDPRNTSQVCSACGELTPKALSVRVHRCSCGYEADRDVNAARNVLALGRSVQAQTATSRLLPEKSERNVTWCRRASIQETN